ncbi:2-dehydropantoate 2-reductase [Acidisphaera rubrifaciens]|uniref:2-dehydropantoate 2-reductase n=1 Tax=Acidisphaera rubrifaciens HS-AP3 TaxID=1231350 RepID=A0A0D6P794_9PROT|nr:2-dehydropantoate 2-reductase [Acidisphaera rubrifaciens]GAN77562.1 2-dehydropantoate 2-reductase [Acidisphaera rubrifaciens HS-AP3]
MRILVVGAGALGGYYGGRLLAAGRDVTFLVRPRRAAELVRHGLVIRSPLGDADLGTPPHLLSEAIDTPYDLIVLACKGYDLDGAIRSMLPAVGPQTAVLPLLNGMHHLDVLRAAFGPAAVLGGLCVIPATLGEGGAILHLAPPQTLVWGELDGAATARADAIAAALSIPTLDVRRSDAIVQEMWEKWMLLATLAAVTCLMQGTIGEIVAVGGADLSRRALAECEAIAGACGHPPRPAVHDRMLAALTEPGSTAHASMLRDMRKGVAAEVEHVLADLLRRRPDGIATPILDLALLRGRVYELQRAGA